MQKLESVMRELKTKQKIALKNKSIANEPSHFILFSKVKFMLFSFF